MSTLYPKPNEYGDKFQLTFLGPLRPLRPFRWRRVRSFHRHDFFPAIYTTELWVVVLIALLLILLFVFFVPDEQFSSVTMWWTWSCSLSLALALAFKTFSYLLNQTSEVHETLPVLFLCQWELVYQFSEKFINFYYPLPITFVVIFSWDLGGLHR